MAPTRDVSPATLRFLEKPGSENRALDPAQVRSSARSEPTVALRTAERGPGEGERPGSRLSVFSQVRKRDLAEIPEDVNLLGSIAAGSGCARRAAVLQFPSRARDNAPA